ncbi:MAG: ribosome biosis GTPase / thiamine phosphate phosphatase [Clostridiales bacterium]|nr:ribosome biosis GTPase / thiamine phosphate phosphatase [Clostridiales bacterium]
MIKGTIYKGIGGFYYVMVDGMLYECKARGKFKNINMTPTVGDFVQINIVDEAEKTGVIETILPRKSALLRPNVSNVDQAIIVFALKNPEPNMMLLDKMILLAENANLDVVLCFNKCDLDDEGRFDALCTIYSSAGYDIIRTSPKTGEGVEALKAVLNDKISVFSGPSGVGKSSLLNAIENGFRLQTGDLSQKIKRGKHTTRHSELLPLKSGGTVVDTPGFTSLSLHEIPLERLPSLFPEFEAVSSSCQFGNCKHLSEPNCAIKTAVETGEIHASRYEAYQYIYHEIETLGRKYKKW